MAENENSERDTHFLGFAGMLYDDIYHRIEQEYGPMHSFRPKIRLAVEHIIAQRAYDLVYHTLDSMKLIYMTPDEVIRMYIPDLTTWPTTKDNDHE